MLLMWQMATPKQKRLAALVMIGLIGLFLVLLLVFGGVSAQADVFDAIESKFHDIYGKISGVITALAGIAIAICAFKWIFGTDPQTVRQAKQWLLNIVIGLAVYWLAFLIINNVGELTKSYQQYQPGQK